MLNAGVQLVAKQLQHGQTTPVLKIPMSFMYLAVIWFWPWTDPDAGADSVTFVEMIHEL